MCIDGGSQAFWVKRPVLQTDMLLLVVCAESLNYLQECAAITMALCGVCVCVDYAFQLPVATRV